MKKYSDEEIKIADEEYHSDKYSRFSLNDLYYEIQKYEGPANKGLLYQNWYLNYWYFLVNNIVIIDSICLNEIKKELNKTGDYIRLKKNADNADGPCCYLIKGAEALLEQNDDELIKCIDLDIETNGTEISMIYDYAQYYHNGCEGFWRHITEKIKKIKAEEDVIKTAEAFEAFFDKRYEQALDLFLDLYQKQPADMFLKNMIGEIYYELQMWNNCIAYLDGVEGDQMFGEAYNKFSLAWASEKIKDTESACKYYKEVLELDPLYSWVNNNLGYDLYRLKRYDEAYVYLKYCIDENLDFPNAKTNYMRLLIAMGKINEAKNYAESIDYKLPKDILRKLEKLSVKDTDIPKDPVIYEEPEEDTSESVESRGTSGRKEETQAYYQFSSEKMFEDELTASLEKGVNIFGIPLKIYKRKGEYGRQYIIPVGRLDLLCEDDKQDLYIIELKKDKGYDDPYVQTREYIDWFEKNKAKKGQKVYGIICLNDPTRETVDKVNADPQVRLFEYKIQYNEIK